ncbi:MAG: hypothetical protein QNL33_13685 [Akkermansiaceae bacterium]
MEAGESNSGGTIDIESAFANGIDAEAADGGELTCVVGDGGEDIEPGIDSVLLGCGRTKDAVRVGDVC